MKLFCGVKFFGGLVLTSLASLAGCSSAARDASSSNSAPVVQNISLTANTTPASMGALLTARYTYFDADNDVEATSGSSIQWLRNSVVISGATGRTYFLTLGDADKTITAAITPLAQTGTRAGLPVVSNAVTAGPSNPGSVVLSVSAGLKQLRFSWAAVPGATFYRVSTNPNGGAGFTALAASSDNLTATAYDWDIAVHRINWPQAQFLLEACDASLCLPSENISALNVMLGSVGYMKASNTQSPDYFGASVALSGDGNTLAVGAHSEDSKTTGINSTPDELANDSGAVYVYTRSGAMWVQQAYVKASNPGVANYFGRSVALSANGNTLAVGANGSDAVYVYTRSAATWSQQAYLKASNTEVADLFGSSVALSADGNTLAVGAYFEDGVNTGVTPGAPAEADAPNGAGESGAVYVFTRSAAATWSQQAYVKASNTGIDDQFGIAVALSADGNTLAVGAFEEDSANTGVTPGAPDEIAMPNGINSGNSGAVYVYTRSATTWAQQTYVKASNTEANDVFGRAVALSADGSTLAAGAQSEASAATGVNNTTPGQSDNSMSTAGAVYLY